MEDRCPHGRRVTECDGCRRGAWSSVPVQRVRDVPLGRRERLGLVTLGTLASVLLFPVGLLAWLWIRPTLRRGTRRVASEEHETVWQPYETYWEWHDTLYAGGSSRSAQWRALALEAKERDRWACTKCGAEESLQVDHIVPLSAGGANDLPNLQTLCRPCHEAKSGRRLPDPWDGTAGD